MITYDYYRIFYYVAQYKSFTRAAEALHNNQPNITRCMNNLESELNCTLFLRSNKGITLTPEGKRLYEHVAIAYEQLSLGEDEIRQNRDLENGLVSIGASWLLINTEKVTVFTLQDCRIPLRTAVFCFVQFIMQREWNRR
jgi:DNA-binding transcriptional LysR family regulator